MALIIDEIVMSDENGVEWSIKIFEGKLNLQKLIPDEVDNYRNRNKNREETLNNATVSFIGYLISVDVSNDSLDVKKQNAETNITLLSREIKSDIGQFKRGDTQPLITVINSSNLPFMDELAKTKLTELLTV